MMNLIAYRVRHITPMQHDWLHSLSDVVNKYFVYVLRILSLNQSVAVCKTVSMPSLMFLSSCFIKVSCFEYLHCGIRNFLPFRLLLP